MAVNKLIVVEDKLEEIFSYLPKMKYSEDSVTEFSVTFGYGDKKALNAFLKQKHKEKFSPYPLIWLLYPYEEEHSNKKVSVDKLTLILAVQTDLVMQNKERLKTTFGKILFPLLDNVRHCFQFANIVNNSTEYDVIKFPNFSGEKHEEDEESAGTFQWDALKVVTDLTLIDTCLKKIIF